LFCIAKMPYCAVMHWMRSVIGCDNASFGKQKTNTCFPA